MENESKIIRVRPFQLPDISNYLKRDQNKEETSDYADNELSGSFSSISSVDAQFFQTGTSTPEKSVSMEMPETQILKQQVMLSPKKNRDKQNPLAECDNWLSFDDLEVPTIDSNSHFRSQYSRYRWDSSQSLTSDPMLFDSDAFNLSSSSEEPVYFPDTPMWNVDDDENDSVSLLSDDSRASRSAIAIRKRMNSFTPLKFLVSRTGKSFTDSEVPLARKSTFFNKPATEDGLELLSDWRKSTSDHLAFDVELFDADDFILEETEPPLSFWNFHDDDASHSFSPHLSLPFRDINSFRPEERDDSESQNSFLYDDSNQRIPRPVHLNDDSSYEENICFSFLDSCTCQSELIRPYRNFDKIEHRQRQRPNAARRRRKKISKRKKKRRLREQREGSHRASNFQCNLSTIVEHSDEDDDNDRPLQSLSALSSEDTQTYSLHSSSTGDGSVNSCEDTPYSDGLYNPREIFLVAAKPGDWELQEMQEI